MHVFRDLLVTAVEETDVRIGGVDDFAIEFENQAQHAVSRRMGWAHVQNHALADEIVGLCMVVVRGACGAGDGVRCLEFLGGGTHAGFAEEISTQNTPIRKGFVKFFTSSPRPQ